MHEAPGHGEGVILSSHTAYDDRGRVVATQPGWRRLSAGADDEKGSEFYPLGPVTLQTYDEETGEPLLSGQDLDGDDQLVPGKDRVAKSERRYEEIDNAWWEVSRQWSYPLEWEGEAVLLSEQRQRLTGLGKPHEDPALGVLVGESVQLVPVLPQKGAEGAKTETLVTRSVTYRNRESGLVTVITTDPKGLVTVQRTEGGLLASVETAGAETAFGYDALGRRVSVVDPRTGESKTVYDPKTGYVAAEIDPEGRAVRYAHYPADHPSAGRLATVADAAGKEQYIAYTPRGEQRAVWGDSVQPLLYEYNDYGERIAMRTFQTLPNGDPSHEEDKGARTAWHYDEATGTLLRKEYADGHGPVYAYTEAGQLKERQWARETTAPTDGAAAPVGTAGSAVRPEGRLSTAYEYDPATLQLLGSKASDGTTVEYEYDAEGRPAKVTDATGTREFAYDLHGQIVKETVTLLTGADSPPIRYEIRRTYTPLGQPESVHLVSAEGEALPLDHKIDYAWNAYGQLASVKSLAGEFEYEYDAKNPALLAKMTGPAHIVETTYEPHRNLITGVTNREKRGGAGSTLPADGTAAVLSSYTYVNDVLGRRETISQGGEAFALLKLGDTKVDVAYNDRGEVVGATYRAGNETRQQFSYEYDGIGNRKEARSMVDGERSTVSYKTNALNQYEAISGDQRKSAVHPSYDLDGNLSEDAKNRYTWDSESRLVRVESKAGDLRIEYLHDYQSRRTVRIETKNPGKENEERRTTCYLYDGWNLLAELESVPSVASRSDFEFRTSLFLTWGRDLSGSLQGAGGVGGLLAVSEGESHRFPAYDANGNVSQLVDESGAITAAYTYDPFGNVTEMAGPEAEENPWRFSTKPVDAGTGWLYYGFRYYNPETGRWLNRDPIGERGGINLYGFVGNRPTGKIDVLGLEFQGDLYVIIGPDIRWKSEKPELGRFMGQARGVDSKETIEGFIKEGQRQFDNDKSMNPQGKKCNLDVKIVVSSAAEPLTKNRFMQSIAEARRYRYAYYTGHGVPIENGEPLQSHTSTSMTGTVLVTSVDVFINNSGQATNISTAYGNAYSFSELIAGAAIENGPPAATNLGVFCCYSGRLPKETNGFRLYTATPMKGNEPVAVHEGQQPFIKFVKSACCDKHKKR